MPKKSTSRASSLQVYCTKCKRKQPIVGAHAVTASNGRKRLAANCGACNSKVSQFVGDGFFGDLVKKVASGVVRGVGGLAGTVAKETLGKIPLVGGVAGNLASSGINKLADYGADRIGGAVMVGTGKPKRVRGRPRK